ncbi:hypothetical protein D3C72_1974530 [compost metagenome]
MAWSRNDCLLKIFQFKIPSEISTGKQVVRADGSFNSGDHKLFGKVLFGDCGANFVQMRTGHDEKNYFRSGHDLVQLIGRINFCIVKF